MPSTVNLLFLRAVAVFSNAALLVLGTILYVFGMFELFGTTAFIALLLAWAVLYAGSRRLFARHQHGSAELDKLLGVDGRVKADRRSEGLSEDAFVKLTAFRVRHRARREAELRGSGFDIVLAITTSALWLLMVTYLASAAGV